MKKQILFILISWFLLTAFSAQIGVKVLYVSPQGNDDNPGTILLPIRNLQTATNRAVAGDTIIMRGGTHKVGQVWVQRKLGQGGKNGEYLTVKAYKGEQPVLQPLSRRFIVHGDYVRIEGLHFIMPWYLDIFGNGNQIINNKFTGRQPPFGAILASGDNILIEGNIVNLTGGGRNLDHGIYVGYGSNNIIRNNRVSGANAYGIHIYEDNGRPIKNLLIEGNYVERCRSQSGIIIASKNTVIDGVIIRNDTTAYNKVFGVYLREGRNIELTNNHFISNPLRANVPYTGSGNTFENTEPPSDQPPDSSRIRILVESLPNGEFEKMYSFQLQAKGGTLPYEWRVTGLPPNIGHQGSSGKLEGIPQSTGTFPIEVGVRSVGTENSAIKLLHLEVLGEVEPPPISAKAETLIVDLNGKKIKQIIYILGKEGAENE